MNISPDIGERALIVGQTGCGKTAFAGWLLPFLGHQFVVIYDTKIEPKFESFPNVSIVQNSLEVKKEIARLKKSKINEQFFIIVRPTVEDTIDPDVLDGMLLYHYLHFHNVACYIDEVYTFHKNGQAGAGLVSLLTRGRSKKITTIMSTQRPKRLSLFCITEAQKFFVFFLADKKDMERLGDVIPDFVKTPRPKKYWFYYYDFDLSKPVLFKPINPTLIDNDDSEAYKESSKHKIWL